MVIEELKQTGFRPMLAAKTEDLKSFDGTPYYISKKVDGICCIMTDFSGSYQNRPSNRMSDLQWQ